MRGSRLEVLNLGEEFLGIGLTSIPSPLLSHELMVSFEVNVD